MINLRIKLIFKILIIFYSCTSFSAQDDFCLKATTDIEVGFNNLSAVPASIEKQVKIIKNESGLRRFTVDNEVVLIDAERVPLLSKKRKTLFPTQNLNGKIFEGIHILGQTNREKHTGIEIFDAELNRDESTSISLFDQRGSLNYFKDFGLDTTPFYVDMLEGENWLLSHGANRRKLWSHHSFLFNNPIELTESSSLYLFFETDFDNAEGGKIWFPVNWINNSFSGSRIDTCVYFLVREGSDSGEAQAK